MKLGIGHSMSGAGRSILLLLAGEVGEWLEALQDMLRRVLRQSVRLPIMERLNALSRLLPD